MARFKFRLASVLRLREAARDERHVRLAEALRAEEVLRTRHAELEGEMAQVQHGQRRRSVGPLDVDALADTHRYAAVLRAEIRVVHEQQQALGVEVERRRQALVAADREVRVLEKLRDKQHQRVRESERANENRQLDEVAGTRALRQEAQGWAD
jgi:flagellar export protein FliJ